jgi:putative cell wall-binding protein
MTQNRSMLLILLMILGILSSCTKAANHTDTATPAGRTEPATNSPISVPWLAMKNTTRINTADPIQAAVTISQTLWPSTSTSNRTGGVILTEMEDWRSGLAAADLIHFPFNGPILFATKEQIPEATLNEIKRLKPEGGGTGKVQVILVGNLPSKADDQLKSLGLRTERLQAENAAALANEVDAYFATMQGSLPPAVIVGSMDQPEYTMPAVNWISHMPEPLLYVKKDEIPTETITALQKRNGHAKIYILGPESVISASVEHQLKAYGTVTRIAGNDPFTNAISFAKFFDPTASFGWNITTPGHNFSFVPENANLLAIAAAPFSHLGKHAPLLWTGKDQLPSSVMEYLMALQPKYQKSPSEGPYNHGWITGDQGVISINVQGEIDDMLEITSAAAGGEHGGHASNYSGSSNPSITR